MKLTVLEEHDYTCWVKLALWNGAVRWLSSMLQCPTPGTRVILVTSSHFCVRGMWLIMNIYICCTLKRAGPLLLLFFITLLRRRTKIATRVWSCASLSFSNKRLLHITAFTSTTRKTSHCILHTARPGYEIQEFVKIFSQLVCLVERIRSKIGMRWLF